MRSEVELFLALGVFWSFNNDVQSQIKNLDEQDHSKAKDFGGFMWENGLEFFAWVFIRGVISCFYWWIFPNYQDCVNQINWQQNSTRIGSSTWCKKNYATDEYFLD